MTWELFQRILRDLKAFPQKVKKFNLLDFGESLCHPEFPGIVTAMCCDATRDVKYGNIYDKSLTELWNGSTHRNFLIMQLKGKRFEHPYCKDCMMPNDIATEADLLDTWAGKILEKIQA